MWCCYCLFLFAVLGDWFVSLCEVKWLVLIRLGWIVVLVVGLLVVLLLDFGWVFGMGLVCDVFCMGLICGLLWVVCCYICGGWGLLFVV